MILEKNINSQPIGKLKINDDSYRLILNQLSFENRYRIFLNIGIKNKRFKSGQDPFIDLRYKNKEILLGGIFVPKNIRNGIMGNILLEILFRVEDSTNIPFVHTGNIKKPIIAKKLLDFGFEADNNDILVQLQDKKEDIPVIKFISKKRISSLSSQRGEQFISIDDSPIERNDLPIIPLNTEFSLTDNAKKQKKRWETMENLDGKIRIFPRRVLNILNQK